MRKILVLIGVFSVSIANASTCDCAKINSCTDLHNYDLENQLLIENVVGCKFSVDK